MDTVRDPEARILNIELALTILQLLTLLWSQRIDVITGYQQRPSLQG